MHGTRYDYRDDRLARVTDRAGTRHAELTWNTTTDRLVRLVVDGAIVDGAITRHPLLGDAHVIGNTAMTALDWARPTEIPAIAEPARLPLGAGGAVLNIIALLAQRAGIAALRYAGPYPTAALWRSLARSFRTTGDETGFTADALDRALRVAREPIAIDFAPAPHERLAVPGGFVELRDGIERAVIHGIGFEPGGSPARLVTEAVPSGSTLRPARTAASRDSAKGPANTTASRDSSTRSAGAAASPDSSTPSAGAGASPDSSTHSAGAGASPDSSTRSAGAAPSPDSSTLSTGAAASPDSSTLRAGAAPSPDSSTRSAGAAPSPDSSTRSAGTAASPDSSTLRGGAAPSPDSSAGVASDSSRKEAVHHCEIWFGDAPYARLATLASDGALIEGPYPIPPCLSPVVGRSFPDALRIALGMLVAEAVAPPLADDARALCVAGPLIWDDLGARAARELPAADGAGDDGPQGGFAVHAALWDRIAPLGLGRLALALAEALAPVVAAAVVRRASRQAARGT